MRLYLCGMIRFEFEIYYFEFFKNLNFFINKKAKKKFNLVI